LAGLGSHHQQQQQQQQAKNVVGRADAFAWPENCSVGGSRNLLCYKSF